jgi:multiple sugar transport system permease protein
MQPPRARAAAKNRPRTGRLPARLLYGTALLLLTLLALASLMPLYWMVTGSLKLQQNAMSVPPELWPSEPTLANYQKLFFGSKPVLRWFLNSLVTASAIAAGAVLTSAMAGYAFARKEFPGRRVLFALILLTMILPREVSLVPLAVMMRGLGWFDTYMGLVVPYLVFPFGIFLIRQFSLGVPQELLDAARIDGAGEVGVFTRIVLPLIKPAVGAVAIFAFVGGWNEYLWQLVIVNDESMLTLPVGVSKLVSSLTSFDLGVAMAGATFAFLPMLAVFLLFQGYFVRGITLGAVKG